MNIKGFLFGVLGLLLFNPTTQAQNIVDQTPPPTVRTMAEWEECGALLVAWRSYPTILAEIVKAAQPECPVWVLCSSNATRNSAITAVLQAGVDTSWNVRFEIVPYDFVWIRDYGPTSVYLNGVDSLALIDWIYNRSDRPKDDALPVAVGAKLGLPVYSTLVAPYDLVNTGGNFMSDGMGTAFASKLVLRNNNQMQDGEGFNVNDVFGTSDHTEATIDHVVSTYMGIDRYIKMEELPHDGIHHIDMHMKLLDEETLLVGEYPAGVSDGPQIEANLQYVLDSFKTSFGRDFRVVRVPMPSFDSLYPPYPGQSALYPTYANMLLVNKTIIIPKYGNPLDGPAIDTVKKYMPGYEVATIDCNQMIDEGGAIHCITKEVGVADPLRIVHAPIRQASVDEPSEWAVQATIQHRSGIEQAWLHFATSPTGPWSTVELEWDPASTQYQGAIPIQAAGSTVYYYIEAQANNGKTMVRPMTAPEGHWKFKVTQPSSTTDVVEMGLLPIYPNPAKAITVVPVWAATATTGTLNVLDAFGREVAVLYEGKLNEGQSRFYLNAANFPAGVYQVVFHTPTHFITQQLVIVK